PKKRTIVAFPYRSESETLRNAGSLYEARLDNGATILTSDLHTLAFAKERVESLKRFAKEGRSVVADKNGALHFEGKEEPLSLKELDKARLPDGITVAYVDGYNNVKLAVRHDDLLKELKLKESELKPDERAIVRVSIHDKHAEAIVAGSSFAVHDGEL